MAIKRLLTSIRIILKVINKVLNKYNIRNNYSLVRISALGAHHDLNQKQINFETVLKLLMN